MKPDLQKTDDIPPNESAPPPAVQYDEQLRNQQTPDSQLIDPLHAEVLRKLHDVLRRSQESADPLLESRTLPFSGTGVDSSASSTLFSVSLQKIFEQLSPRFALRRILGKGSFGSVYLARDEVLQRDVAIKIPHQLSIESPDLRVRFLRESRAVARLNHPHIVRVLDSGQSDSLSWLVAEYVHGPRLSEFRSQQGGTLSPRESAQMLLQLADAMHHAHEHGVLHRDIKPENILLEQLSATTGESISGELEASKLIPRVTDFGLARLVDEEIGMSHSGMLIGTPRYMAPEQLQGKSTSHGPWTDVYSLGVVLFELLTGAVPHADADSLHSRIAAIERPVQSPRLQKPDIPRDLETICLKCLSPRTTDRYQTASELRDDLQRFLDGRPTLARPLPWREQLVRWALRNRLLATLLTLLLISVMSVLVQAIASDRVSRQQNRDLSATLNLLTQQKDRADSLLTLAENNRVVAEENESRFRELAWNSSIREAMLAMRQHRYLFARETLETLRDSHPDYISRPDWQLASQELNNSYRLIYEADYALNTIVAVPGTPWIAVAGESYDVDIIDPRTRRRIKTIRTNIHSIHALAVTQDGKRLAVGGRTCLGPIDRSFPEIYSLETGFLLQTLSGHPTTIESLQFSPDGTRLVSGCRYEPVRIYNLTLGTEMTLQTERKNEWLAVSADGSEVLALAKRDTVVVASVDDPARTRFLKGSQDLSYCVPIPGTRLIACVEYQNFGIEFINIDTGEHVARQSLYGKSSSCVAVDDDSTGLFVGRVDGGVMIFDLPSELPAANAAYDASVVSSESVASDVPSLSGQVRSEVAALDSECIMHLAVHEKVLYTCGLSGRVFALELPKQISRDSDPATAKIDFPWRSAAITARGEVFAGHVDGSIYRVTEQTQLRGQRQVLSLTQAIEKGLAMQIAGGTGTEVARLAVSDDGSLVAWQLGSDGIALQNILLSATNIFPGVPADHKISLNALAIAPDKSRMAWASYNEDSFRFASTGRSDEVSQRPIEANIFSMQYSQDSSRFAFGGSTNEVTICNSNDMSMLLELKGSTECHAICWHQSDDSLLLGFVDGYIQIRSATEDGPGLKRMIHQQTVTSIVALPESDFAVSVDQFAQVAVWNSRTLELAGILFEPPLPPKDFVFVNPRLRVTDSGRLMLVYDDGVNGPQIVSWCLQQVTATSDDR